MLILTRKLEEVINVGDKMTIKILSIKDGQVKLGIEAPKDLPIYRGELYQEILKQNRTAASTARAAAAKTAGLLRTITLKK